MKNINPEGNGTKNDSTGHESGSDGGQRSLTRTVLLLVAAFTVNDLFIVRPLVRRMAERQKEKIASESNTDTDNIDVDESEDILIELGGKDNTKNAETSGLRYIFLENEYLKLRVNTRGLLLDTLFLKKYSDNEGNIRLLEPKKSTVSIGWQAISRGHRVPKEDSLWTVENVERGSADGGKQRITLTHSDGDAKFRVVLSMDEKYMIDVEQTVENGGNDKISLRPLWQIRRKNPKIRSRHEMFHFSGGLGVFDGRVHELKSKKIKNNSVELNSASWAGLTSQYWLTALISGSAGGEKATFLEKNETTSVQLTSSEVKEISGGSSSIARVGIFAGPKSLEVLKDYSKTRDIKLLDRSVDFGLFYFLAKPLNSVLNFIYRVTKNFGMAIILLTVLIKLILYPTVKKSFISMSLMKEMQPKMKALQVMYGKDSERFRREVVKLYEKYKLNPFASIVPILAQIPVFFSLYRVISVSLNMRQAPFFWFIRDLSAADPSNLLNPFGLLPYRTKLKVGLLPCVMAFTMYLQQKCSDHMMGTTLQPKADNSSDGPKGVGQEISSTNAKMMKFMPLIFMFMFSSFPSGLLVYWIFNNIITVIQQYYIFKNIKNWLKRRENGGIL
ncbi:MAG: membrane protein insertase YidC [Rickettsiales bacterium]|jgi:YidC/Oxa1 family membrane protein insertase|nr:membrane protein insertase YidC [Rickettsiales bacterium]